MERWRDAAGQATSEYVALVALVAVVLALAAGLTAGGVAGQVLAGLQRGICQLAGTACASPSPAGDDLAPCPVERTAIGESLQGAFELVRVGGGGTLTTVRGSDGRVTVTLASATTAGGEIGIGAELALGDRHGGTTATAQGERSGASSRSWTLPNAAAARAFVERHGSTATVAGKAVDLVRSGCSILCDAVGWRPHAELPPPDETSFGRGTAATLTASLGPASLSAADGSLLGAQLRRDGSSTWFFQVGTTLGADLGLGAVTAGVGSDRKTVVAFTLDARRRPTELQLHAAARIDGTADVRLGRGRMTAKAEAGGARVTELEATLDLRDARNRSAAAALAATLRDPVAADTLRHSAAAVRERIARTGVVDRRTYALASSTFGLGVKLAVGGPLGAGFERTHEGMRLLSAETRLPGLPFLPRDDCRPA